MNDQHWTENSHSNDITPGLISRCGRGDAEAWSSILSDARKAAFNLARWRHRLGWEDAEDVAQTVQIKVAEKLSQLREPGSFGAWVRQLTYRAVVDLVRSRRPVVSLDDPEWRSSEGAAGEEASFDQILLRLDVEKVLRSLPDLYREPVRLSVMNDVPQDEIGRRLNRPRSTVATQVERGLSRLRRVASAALAE